MHVLLILQHAQVIAEILGGWFKTLPTRAGERGLILMTCGYVVTDAASENQLWALVDTYVT